MRLVDKYHPLEYYRGAGYQDETVDNILARNREEPAIASQLEEVWEEALRLLDKTNRELEADVAELISDLQTMPIQSQEAEATGESAMAKLARSVDWQSPPKKARIQADAFFEPRPDV